MPTVEERLNRVIAGIEAAKNATSGGVAGAATPPSSVMISPTLQERLNRMKTDGQAAKMTSPVSALLSGKQLPASPATPSTPSGRSAAVPTKAVELPISRADNVSAPATPYAAGLQAKQAAEVAPKGKEYPTSDWSTAKSVVGALRKGAGMIAQAGADTLAFAEDIAAMPFEFVGQQPFGELSDTMPFNRMAEKVREEQRRTGEYYKENMEKGGKLAEGIETLGAATVAAVPQAVAAMLTGGGSIAAKTSVGVARASEAALSPGVATTVKHVVEEMAKNPQYWLSFVQVVGGGYEDALADQREIENQKREQARLAGERYTPPKNENGIRAKAALYAVGNGLLNAAVEVGGGIQTLPAQLQMGQSAWRAWVDGMVDEGKEGVVQGVIERALQGIYGKQNPVFSTSDENAVVNPMTAVQEFAGDAIVGGILGGGQIALSHLTLGTAQDMTRQAAEMAGAQKTAPVEGAEYRAVKPQNVEMPTVPLIELSTKDIPGVKGVFPQTGESLRKDAITRARNRLGLDQRSAAYIPVSNVQRDGNEYVLKITKTSLNKMLHPAADAALPVESIVIMDNLERIANNGVYFKSEGDRAARPQIPGWDHLMTTVYIDGEPYSVDMRVKLIEEKPGSGADNVLYYYSPEEILTIEKVGSKAPTVERRALNMNSELKPTSGPIIPTSGNGVKTEYAQPGTEVIPAEPDAEARLRQTAEKMAQDAETVDPEQAALEKAIQELAAGGIAESADDPLSGMDILAEERLRRTAQEMAQDATDAQAQKTAPTEKPKMRMEDFTSTQSPVWNNVAYEDTETQRQIMRDTHQRMVDSGEVVTIPRETMEQVGEYYPDLRNRKKAERIPILKQKMGELKNALRGVLNGLKGSHEFEVNGNILEVKLYDAGISEVLEKITQSKAAMLTHSAEIFRGAQYMYSTPDYDGDPNIYRWNYFYTPVQMGEEMVGVRIAVRDMKQTAQGQAESQIYHWGIKKDVALDGESPGTKPLSFGVSSATSSGPIIPSSGNGVNIEYAQPGTEVIPEELDAGARLRQTAEKMAQDAETVDPEQAALEKAIQELAAGGIAELADDPLSGMDILAEERLRRTAQEMAQDATDAQAQKTASTEGAGMTLVQRIRDAIPQLKEMQTISQVRGTELPAGDRMIDRIVSFANAIGNKVNRPGFGDVLFSRTKLKNGMLGHGFGQAKVETFAAVPDVIKYGKQIDFKGNYDGRGYDTYTFAGPIDYLNKATRRMEKTFLGVIVTKDKHDGRYYVHEVVDENGNLIFRSKEDAEVTSDGRATLSGAIDTVATSASKSIVPDLDRGVKVEDEAALHDEIVEDKPGKIAEEDQQQLTGAGLPEEQNRGKIKIQEPMELTEDETASLLDYKSSWSYKINAILRDNEVMDQEDLRKTEALDRAIRKLPKYQGRVYRRLSFDMVGQTGLDAFLAEHQPGTIVGYSAYTSTSKVPDGYPMEGELTVMMIIEGKTGRSLDNYGNNNEVEVLFGREGRFYVDKIEIDPDGRPVIYMEEVVFDGSGQFYSQERSEAVQQMQARPTEDGDL